MTTFLREKNAFRIVYFLSWKAYAVCKLHKTNKYQIGGPFSFTWNGRINLHCLHVGPDPDLVWMHDTHVVADMYGEELN